MLEEMLKNVREKSPLIHNITNYVTVNDCANVVLACGASPIMADDQEEVAEITSICTGLNINIGTLNMRTIESMVIAGKKANELHHPVVILIGDVDLHSGEFRIVRAVHSFVTEVLGEFIHAFKTTYDEALQIQLIGNTQIERNVKRVMVCDERTSGSSTRNSLQNRSLNLHISFAVEKFAHG